VEKIVVVGMAQEVNRLRTREKILCRDMNEIRDALLRLKTLEYPVAQVKYHIGASFCILVKSKTEAIIMRGDMSGVVSSDRNWAKGELTLVTNLEGSPYLCLGGLADVKDVVDRGMCWIYEGDPAMVKLYFWLNKRKQLPLAQKIPRIIRQSERLTFAAIEQVLQPV